MNDSTNREDVLLQNLPAIDRDGLFAFALFVPMLFIVQFGTFGAFLFVLVALLWAFVRRRSLATILHSRWYVLFFPAFIVVSTLWSDSPAETLKHSLEFSITVLAALLLVSSRNPRAMLLGLFSAFLLYAIVSVLFGNKVDVGNYGARALSGLGLSKNEAADIAGSGFVISAFLALTALRSRRWLASLIFTGATALQIYVATAALSTGAIAAMTIALAGLLLSLAMRKGGEAARVAFVAMASVFVVAIVAVFESFGGSVLRWLASFLGKDPTLTGRTYLWFRARDLAAEHPFLGRGFGAFWQQGNLDAEGLWQFAQITSRQGFNFHNTLYDTLVSLGWAGVVVLGLAILFGLGKVARGYVAQPTLLSCFWLGMALYLFIRMPTESVGLTEFYFSTVLLFACLGSGIPAPIDSRVSRSSPGSFRALPAARRSALSPRLVS